MDKTVERDGKQLRVVGRSRYVADLQAGFREADNAALEHLSQQLAEALAKDPNWSTHVQAQFAQQRQKAMRALEEVATSAQPDPVQLDTAKRVVREGRARVAAALRDTAGPLVPAERADFYWQKFKVQGGDRFRVAVLHTIPNVDFDKLTALYATAGEARGVRVVTHFPGLAWRGGSRRGVIVVGIGPEAEAERLGLRGGDKILAIDDIPVLDAVQFAKTVQAQRVVRCRKEEDMVWSVTRDNELVGPLEVAAGGGCPRPPKRNCQTPRLRVREE
ncbi:MAG: hypothetical protein HY906_20970 [Deltaproteobacteria bacterium]|nr:hypothetical protein [Deltaproteobacteria bacterium]